jgi:hypothetical protein
MSAGIKGMTVGFPEEAIGPGDSWTVDTEVGGQFGQFAVTRGTRASPTRMTFTVKRVVVSPSDTTVELRIKTVPPVGPIQLNVGGQRARLKLSGELSGKQRFSLTRGAVVDGTMGGVMKMDISMPALASLAMAITSQLQSTLRLQGAP